MDTDESIQSMAGAAHSNTDWNIAPISSTKMTGPKIRCVSTRSMRARVRASLPSPRLETATSMMSSMAS